MIDIAGATFGRNSRQSQSAWMGEASLGAGGGYGVVVVVGLCGETKIAAKKFRKIAVEK